jgi:hypothetical protein
MVSIQEMLIENVKEETEEKIYVNNDSPYLIAKSSSDEGQSWSTLIGTYSVFFNLSYF